MATEAVSVAISATNDLIEDPARRQAVVQTYSERLIGSDVGRLVETGPVAASPDLARLYDAVGAFLMAVPAEALSRSRRVVASIVAPPLLRYHRLGSAGRAAHRRLVAIVLSARLERAAGRSGRVLVRLGLIGGIARALAVHAIRRPVRRLRRWVRIRRQQWSAPSRRAS